MCWMLKHVESLVISLNCVCVFLCCIIAKCDHDPNWFSCLFFGLVANQTQYCRWIFYYCLLMLELVTDKACIYIYIAVWANILDGFKGLVEHIFYWKLWFFPFHKWGHGWVAHFKPLLGCKRFAELRIFDGSTPCVFVSLLAGGTPIYSGQTQMLTD